LGFKFHAVKVVCLEVVVEGVGAIVPPAANVSAN